jgi:drug/metabolite transporter (DMT)-like permease
MDPADADRTGRATRIGIALATLWLVWGSTYYVVSSIIPVVPPFALSSSRFLVAGPLLGIAAVARREAWPSGRQLAGSAAVGALLFLGGNGGTVWSQGHVSSGVAAVLVGCVPMWVTVLSWLAFGERPPPARIAAIALGVLGVAGLVGSGEGSIDPIGIVGLLAATSSWATGTLLSHRVERPTSILFDVAVQMATGGVLLAIAAALNGSWAAIDPSRIRPEMIGGFCWLVFAGSIAAIIAYNWLLRHTTPALATTYAYVNPLVAVALGWWLGGERLGPVALASAGAVVGSVALITVVGGRGDGKRGESTSAAPRPAG